MSGGPAPDGFRACQLCKLVQCVVCHHSVDDHADADRGRSARCRELAERKSAARFADIVRHTDPAQNEGVVGKACPGCFAVIQKTGGCNCMMCSRCGGWSCWLCGEMLAKSGEERGHVTLFFLAHAHFANLDAAYNGFDALNEAERAKVRQRQRGRHCIGLLGGEKLPDAPEYRHPGLDAFLRHEYPNLPEVIVL